MQTPLAVSRVKPLAAHSTTPTHYCRQTQDSHRHNATTYISDVTRFCNRPSPKFSTKYSLQCKECKKHCTYIGLVPQQIQSIIHVYSYRRRLATCPKHTSDKHKCVKIYSLSSKSAKKQNRHGICKSKETIYTSVKTERLGTQKV